jgi:hypothetical protein
MSSIPYPGLRTDPMTAKPFVFAAIARNRFTCRFPRPLWIGFVAVILLVGSMLLTTGLTVHRRLTAISAIESRGGAVGTVGHRSGWQRQSFGYPTFKAVEVVEFVNWENGALSDADVAWLLDLPSLRRLNLRNARITGARITRLKQLPHLELVLLEGSDATEAEIDELRRAAPGVTIRR